jgi:methyltransferase (TIGR00027 family)
MPAFGKVAATAFIVAECRAEENTQAEPLYRDPVVAIFLNDETRRAAASAAAPHPAAKKGVRLRTRYFDDMLDLRVASGCRQIVILGAGLDTRAQRKGAEGVAYFEIDDPSIVAFKRSRLAECGMQAGLTLIAGNYVDDDWLGALEAHRFDPELPTHFIWEGNTMYLPPDGLKCVLECIRDHVRDATISFDYFSRTLVEKTTGDATLTELADRFERIGAPWISGIADIHALSRQTGFELLDDTSVAELHRRHWRGRPMGSTFFSFYSVCTLANRRSPGDTAG